MTLSAKQSGKKGTSSSCDDEYSEEDNSRERGRSKRQKKRKKEEDEGSQSPDERERSSSGGSSPSESSSASFFGGAGGGKNGLASKLQKVARRHPGRLLQKTLRAMHATLKPGSAPLPDHQKPAIFFNFLQRTLSQRPRKDGRAEREMTTLAMACDRILEGKLEEALDVMSQRFKRVEAQDSGELKGHVASRLELIPAPRVTSLSLEEREEVVDLDRKWQEYQAGREGLGQEGRFAAETAPPGSRAAAPPTPPRAADQERKAKPGREAPSSPRRLPALQRVRWRSPTPMREGGRGETERKPIVLTPAAPDRSRPPAAEEAPALTRAQRKRRNWRARLKEKKKFSASQNAAPQPPAAAKPNDQPMPWRIQGGKGKGTNRVKDQKGKAKGKRKW